MMMGISRRGFLLMGRKVSNLPKIWGVLNFSADLRAMRRVGRMAEKYSDDEKIKQQDLRTVH